MGMPQRMGINEPSRMQRRSSSACRMRCGFPSPHPDRVLLDLDIISTLSRKHPAWVRGRVALRGQQGSARGGWCSCNDFPLSLGPHPFATLSRIGERVHGVISGRE